jgi:hypothetical protein
MKPLRVILLLSVGLGVALFAGCEIVTEQLPAPLVKPANNVVINELFILPPPNSFAYHWIEFYNPTNGRIRMTNWTLGLRTKRFFIVSDTTGLIVKAFIQDSVARYYDVHLQDRTTITIDTTVIQFSSPFSIPAYNFMTIVSDAERMKNYTAWGSEGGVRIDLARFRFNGQPIFGFENFLFYRADSTQKDSLIRVFYNFTFENSDQIVLKDSMGVAIDVLRYGNYIYAGPPAVDYPNNRSLGPIVPYQSFARFAGAYTSGSGGNAVQGSSADDFYVTGVQIANTVPIPHWLSQAYKEQ